MRVFLLRFFNYLLYITTCATISAGLVLHFKLSPGPHSGNKFLLGLNRHDWRSLHFYLSVGFMVLTIAHLFLNWGWIKKVAAKNKLVLAMTLMLGLIIILLPLLLPLAV